MSLLLPPKEHPVREFIDIAYLAELGATNTWPTLQDARFGARNTFANNPGVKEVHIVCMRANGDIQLVRFRPRSWKKVWNFSR